MDGTLSCEVVIAENEARLIVARWYSRLRGRSPLERGDSCNKWFGYAANLCGLRHIYMVLGVFRTILSTVVFWPSWQACKPNNVCYNSAQNHRSTV